LVLAIEVLIYTTKHLTTIFVSKADSTGYLSTLELPRSQAGSPLKAIAGTFLSWLMRERQREGKKLVVSLFARAQDQYLFPASVDCPTKHILDDRGLVKWWCKVLDPLVREYAGEDEKRTFTERLNDSKDETVNCLSAPKLRQGNETTAKGYLVIPGFESYETARYIPAPPTPTASKRWVTAHPLLEIAPHPGAPPRCIIPHFPDDPKARFLDELDEELPDRDSKEMMQPGGTPSRSNGQWKSVKTLDQFWELMAYRQECSSGRITGFIWVVLTPPKPSIPEEDEEDTTSSSQPQSQSQSQSFLKTSTTGATSLPTPKSSQKKKKPRRCPMNTTSGPIPIRLPRIKSASSNLSTSSPTDSSRPSYLPPESTPYFIWPPSSRGTLLFSVKDYARAHEVLLQQNFSTRTAAVRSTRRWKEEVCVLGGVDEWGWKVVGRKEGRVQGLGNGNGNANGNGNGNGVSGPSTGVTTLLVTKKRKVDKASEMNGGEGGVQVLGEGLVRKKVKVEEAGPGAAQGQNGVNVLGAGLVRKKSKS
jgi:regulator of Ty1 transposition protein 109